MQETISFVNISKSFVPRSFKHILLRKPVTPVKALDDVTISIKKGQVFGLLGSNGAGKTTLIKLVAGLVTPDLGHIELFGKIINETNMELILAKVGLVTNNERSFYWRLSGRQNLSFFATLNNLSAKERPAKIARLLELVEIEDVADRPFMTYSSGQKQRFAIARSLLNNPDILLFDEATSNLDPISTKNLIDFVKNILVGEQQQTVLWCTHNLAEAEKVCNNLAILHKGKVVANGSLEEMQAKVTGMTEYVISVKNWRESVTNQLRIVPATIDQKRNNFTRLIFKCTKKQIPDILQDLLAQRVEVYECARVSLQLEEIFEKEIKWG